MLFEGSITDVKGIRVGQAQNMEARTGVTVVLADGEGAAVAADVRGAAPGTRETDLCRPENTVEKANAVVLAGGSAFGLAAATGVMEYLEEKNIGVDMGVCHVPIVPAAVVFDLMVGDAHVRPDAQMGREACENASKEVQQGGVGTASIRLASGVTVGAIAVVNACGDVYDIQSGQPIGCGHLPDGTPVLCDMMITAALPDMQAGKNTTIAVVATDAKLTKAEAQRMATCAHDGYARAIRPVHTQMDGDTIFALATGQVEHAAHPVQLCAAAAEVMARAINNAILAGKQA